MSHPMHQLTQAHACIDSVECSGGPIVNSSAMAIISCSRLVTAIRV
jgi:hypothetical protein